MKRFISQHPRALSAAIGIAAACSMFVAVPVASASGLTASQVSAIVTMLQAFGADSATIANVQAALTGTPAPSQTTTSTSTPTEGGPGNASSCMSLSGTLSVGSEGADVTKLQQFLASSTPYYPQGLVTGYYGQETEHAVEQYQAAHGIVATGTPSSTGYGIVGPTTRGELEREMETECNSGDSNQGSSEASSTASSSEGESHATTTASSTDSNTSSGSHDN